MKRLKRGKSCFWPNSLKLKPFLTIQIVPHVRKILVKTFASIIGYNRPIVSNFRMVWKKEQKFQCEHFILIFEIRRFVNTGKKCSITHEIYETGGRCEASDVKSTQ